MEMYNSVQNNVLMIYWNNFQFNYFNAKFEKKQLAKKS